MMMAEAGDVIVIDCGGDVSPAVIGGLVRTTAVARTLGGFVLGGALRDLAGCPMAQCLPGPKARCCGPSNGLQCHRGI